MEAFHLAAVGADNNFTCRNLFDNACFLCKDNNAGINRRFVFHAGADDRGFGFEKRHSLPLHVRTHQSTVCVIVLEKRNHCRRYRNNHLW